MNKEEPNYEEIIDDEFSFPRFSEDPKEQNRLNVRHALKKAQSGMSLTEVEQNLLINNGLDDFVKGGQTLAAGVDASLIAAPFLAKPAILSGALTGTANLIKKYPLKALEVGLTGIGASDYKDNPQDLVLETLGMKTDTMFTGGKKGPFNPVANLGIKKLTKIFTDILDGPNPKFAGEGSMLMSKSDDATGGISKKGFNPNITKKNLELFNQIGWTKTAKLDIQDMLYGIDDTGAPLMSQYKRRVLKAGIGDETFNWSAFTKNRDAVVKDFLDGLQDLNIDPKTIHGHHISALRITSSLFDGLSPIQRKKLIKIFQREGLQLGNHPDNLMALHQSTHLDVVHPFLEKQIGKYGQLLIDPVKIKKMTPKQREELVVKFAKIIKKSEEIALNDTRKWLDKEFLNMSPEAAFQAKLGMLEDAFEKEVALRELLLDNIVYPRRTSKNVRFKNLLKKVEKQLKLNDIDSPRQLEIWDIDDNTLEMFSDLLNQN
tara:strand:+ start:54 stop:1517 length:1464 start_codon:yes stop_codon:yes gene_type:complete